MNPNSATVLLVEDDPTFAEAFKLALKKEPIVIEWAMTGKDALQRLKDHPTFAVMVIDQHLPDIKGDELAGVVHKQFPEQQIVFATGDLTSSTLTSLLASGLAVGFIPKGQSIENLIAPVKKAIFNFQTQRKIHGDDGSRDVLGVERNLAAIGIIGRSEALRKVLDRRAAYRRLAAPTLITGESGSGKEVIAQALVHGVNEILPVNCSTYVGREHLMESELFGVVRGAFTGADKDRPGLFELAKGRVIFLDEVHHLPPTAQAKLLRVLQEKRIIRVGDNSENSRPCDFQLISAGKPEIREMMKSGLFLPDLYFRISTYQINLPPINERPEDIEPLIEHFAKELRHKSKMQKRFRASTIRLMERYPWTGEVREIKNMVAELFGETKSDIIEPKDFTQALERKWHVSPRQIKEDLDHETYMKTMEIAYIKKALSASLFQKDAAQRMNISKSTLNHRLKILGINADDFLGVDILKNRRLAL